MKSKNTVIWIASMLIFSLVGMYGAYTFRDNGYILQSPIVFRSPIAHVKDRITSPMSTQSAMFDFPIKVEAAEIVETDPIRKEIREVFGDHADKAFAVLSCENGSLNPDAVNTAGNSPEGSRDVGIFQINEYWQGVSNINFLKDPSINIRMAWNIFRRDGYSFKLWTCGRKLGV